MARIEAIGTFQQKIKHRFSSHPVVWGVPRMVEDPVQARNVEIQPQLIADNLEDAVPMQEEKQFIEVRIFDPENYSGAHNQIMKYPKQLCPKE